MISLFVHKYFVRHCRLRSSRPEVFCKKGFLRNFVKFTGTYLCQCLFFNVVAGLRTATLLKKGFWKRCFPVNFAKFLRISFLTENLRWLLLCLYKYWPILGQYFNHISDTYRKRLVFQSIQYRNGWLVASDLFDMFTQSVKFYTFYYQYRCLKNGIHQIDSKNGWLLRSASFTAKFEFLS